MFDNLDKVIEECKDNSKDFDDYPTIFARKYWISFEIINEIKNLSFLIGHEIEVYDGGGGAVKDIDSFLNRIIASMEFNSWEKTDECRIEQSPILADPIREEDEDFNQVGWMVNNFIKLLKRKLKTLGGYNFDYKEEENND